MYNLVIFVFATLGCQPDVATPTPPAEPTANVNEPPPTGQASSTVTSVEAVYAQADTLSGQSVTVKGEVVKFNANILDRNWVHLRDGTGDVTHGTNDLTITTEETVAVGDTVTFTGTIALNKDFSAGYKYPVLLEKASLGGSPGHAVINPVHPSTQVGKAAAVNPAALPPGHPPVQNAAEPKPSSDRQTFSGAVEEVVHAGNKYSYLRMTVDGERLWAAVPHDKFTVGQTVSVRGEFNKESFASPSLNRTFKNVWFGTRIATKAEPTP